MKPSDEGREEFKRRAGLAPLRLQNMRAKRKERTFARSFRLPPFRFRLLLTGWLFLA